MANEKFETQYQLNKPETKQAWLKQAWLKSQNMTQEQLE